MGCHDAGGSHLLARDLRVPVDISTHLDELFPHALQPEVDPVHERFALRVDGEVARGDEEGGEESGS